MPTTFRAQAPTRAWFAYNPAGQVAASSRDNDAYAFTAFAEVSRDYAANGLNQYTSAGPATFTYDANGNLTSDGGTAFLYDVENRLVSASGGKTAALRYDPLGRLYEVAGTQGATRFLYDGDALMAELTPPGTFTHYYAHGANPGADDPLVWYVVGAEARWLHADRQGSIVAWTNSGPAQINRYDEWGIPAATNTGRFQYTGQAWLGELGMYHYKARIYSPTLGRFLQTDPVGYEDQMNLYAYVRNDPVNMVDPTGMMANTCSRVGGTGCSGSYASDRAASRWTTPKAERIYDRAAKRGDAYASPAKQFGKENPKNGDIARSQAALFKELLIRNGAEVLRKGEGPFGIDFLRYGEDVRSAALAEYRLIREDLAVTYERMMRSDANGRASVNQVYNIHVEVFERYKISMRMFGGSPLSGTRAEAIVTSPVWCPGCLGQ